MRPAIRARSCSTGSTRTGTVIATGASPPFPFGGIAANVVIFMAPPNSVSAALVTLDPARTNVATAAVSYGAVMVGGTNADGTPSAVTARFTTRSTISFKSASRCQRRRRASRSRSARAAPTHTSSAEPMAPVPRRARCSGSIRRCRRVARSPIWARSPDSSAPDKPRSRSATRISSSPARRPRSSMARRWG